LERFRNEYVAHQDRELSDPEFAKPPLLKEVTKIKKFLLFYLAWWIFRKYPLEVLPI
jgi:hypothetical protein